MRYRACARKSPPRTARTKRARLRTKRTGAALRYRVVLSEIQTPFIPAHSASLRAFTPVFDGLWTRVNALLLSRGAPRGDERTFTSPPLPRRSAVLICDPAS